MPPILYFLIGSAAGALCCVAAWLLLADRLGRLAVERGGTALLGARVDVRSLHIALTRGNVTRISSP